jgi:AraC-like DNA-binding protein
MEENAPAGVFEVDLSNLHPAQRMKKWADFLYDHFYPLDVSSPENFGFGHFSAIDVGHIRVGSLESDPQIVHRRPTHVGRAANDYVFLPISLDQPITLRQRGRAVTAGPDDFAFVSTGDAYTYEQPLRTSIYSLRLPGKALKERLCNADDLTASAIHANNAMSHLFLDFARSFCKNRMSLIKPGAQVADRFLDLLALTLQGADQHTSETAVRAAHRQRALAMVDRLFHKSELTPTAIAAALGLSERYLQKIFAQRDETLSGLIRGRRVAEARRMLADRGTSRASVSAIAYAVGFTDPAHFSRVFRQQTGVAPVNYHDDRAISLMD